MSRHFQTDAGTSRVHIDAPTDVGNAIERAKDEMRKRNGNSDESEHEDDNAVERARREMLERNANAWRK